MNECMIMKKFFLGLLLLLTVMLMVNSCSSNTATESTSSGDTVTVAVVKLTDTTSFKKSNGEVCRIYADATFNYPTSFKDKPMLEKLQRLYALIVLETPDSLTLNDAMQQCVSNSLHQYDLTSEIDEAPIDMDEESSVMAYHTSTNVQLHYNRNQLVTFCKVEMVKKDSLVTSVTHKFYTFDLKDMTQVTLSRLFRDDARMQLTKLLRMKLLEQNKVENNDQLNELGYYNIDNLVVNNNFYCDEKGLTWCYMPNELAVSAIGEPRVTLDYESLSSLTCEGSLLPRMK